MKLKKIASLALAGVMAVSMLAGCAGKTGTTDDGTTVVTDDSTAVSIFNDQQSAAEFTSDAELDAALAKAVAGIGTNVTGTAAEGYVKSYIQASTGMGLDNTFSNKKGDTTILVVKRYNVNAAWSQESAVMQAVKSMDELEETTFEKGVTKTGDTYYDFTYTGNVSVATATNGQGQNVYFVAYTVTQHGVEQTFELGA